MTAARSKSAVAALLIPLALALACGLPALLELRWSADDYAFATLLERGDGLRVDWNEVARQGHERWLFSHAYWRPLVTLSLALNFAVTGGDPRGFGAVNLLLHLLAVACVAGLCRALARGPMAGLGALLGACFFAVHPLAVEPVCWISARVSTLEVALGALACLALLAHARGAGRRAQLGAVLAFGAALASKESALAWLVAFLCVDLLDAPRRPWRARLALHTPMLAMALLYLGVRVALLGSIAGSELASPPLVELAGAALRKLVVLVAPDALAGAALLLCALATLSHARTALPRVLLALGLCGAWALAMVLPAFAHRIETTLVGSRLVYGAVLPLALFVAFRAAQGRFGAVAAAVALVGLLPAGHAALGRYRAAWQTLGSATAALDARADAADAERPQVVVSMPLVVPGEIHPMSYPALGAAPFTARVRPVISLAAVRYAQPFAPTLFGDPHPLFAMLEHGSPIAAWQAEEARLHWPTRAAIAATLERADEPRRATLRFAQPVEACSVEALAIETDAVARGGVIRIATTRGSFGAVTDLRFGGGEPHGEGRRFTVDLTHHAPLLVAILGDIRTTSLELELDSGALRAVQPLPRLPVLPLGAAPTSSGADAAPRTLDQWLATLRAPTSIATRLELVIVSPVAAHVVPCVAGEPVRMPRETAATIRAFASSALRADRLWYWFVARGADPGEPGAARSKLAVVTLRKDA